MWSDTISLKFANQAEWLALGLENSHTFDAVELGVFTREDGTQSTGWHVDCTLPVNAAIIGTKPVVQPCLTYNGQYAGEMPEELQPFVINPATKRHEYA